MPKLTVEGVGEFDVPAGNLAADGAGAGTGLDMVIHHSRTQSQDEE